MNVPKAKGVETQLTRQVRVDDAVPEVTATPEAPAARPVGFEAAQPPPTNRIAGEAASPARVPQRDVHETDADDDLYRRASLMTSVVVAADAPLPPLPDEPGLERDQLALIHPDDHSEWVGTVYDAQAFLALRLNLPADATLHLFHQSKRAWAEPGARGEIRRPVTPGGFGAAFYTSTAPETTYGGNQFQLGIPLAVLAGKKLFEVTQWRNGGQFLMPRGVDIAVARHGDHYWVALKPGAEKWVNAVATTARFDRPTDTPGWDAD